MTYPPLAILGGRAPRGSSSWLEPWTSAWGPTCRRDVTAGLVFSFSGILPVVRSTTEEAWAARADVRFAQSVVPELRGNPYVLTHNPGMFHVWGVNAGQMSLIANNPSHLDLLERRYARGIYLHWNFWCNVQDPIQREFCQTALAMHPAEAVAEYRREGTAFRALSPASRNGRGRRQDGSIVCELIESRWSCLTSVNNRRESPRAAAIR